MFMDDIEKLFRMRLNRPITCAFSGCRPHKAPLIYRADGYLCETYAKRLNEEISRAVGLGYKFFLSGGGLGFDLAAAEGVISAREKMPYLRLIFALPCANHSANWTSEQKKRFKSLKAEADDIIYVSDGPYEEGCMKKRNHFLVDCASMLITIETKIRGGTMQTIAYAKKNHLEIALV